MLRLYTTLFFWTIKKNEHVIFRAFLRTIIEEKRMDSPDTNNYVKTKVLIVEDARAVRSLEVSMLQDMGFKMIIEAEDGQKSN
jgi:hypothetical protein